MAFKITDAWETVVEQVGVPGAVAGIGAVVLAPVLIPAIAKVGKPIAKAAIKGGIVLYEKSRGALAEAGEILEDLVAEAKVELAEEAAVDTIETNAQS